MALGLKKAYWRITDDQGCATVCDGELWQAVSVAAGRLAKQSRAQQVVVSLAGVTKAVINRASQTDDLGSCVVNVATF